MTESLATRNEFLIVGAGVMGTAIAYQLAARGASVTVLERSVPGAEASSAAAGMLGAEVEVHHGGPFLALCRESRGRFPALAEALRAETGIDIEFRKTGILKVARTAAEREALRGLAELHGRALLADGGRALEPALAEGFDAACLFADDGRIDPPKYLKALRIAATRRGAVFLSGKVVRHVLSEGDRVVGVELEGGAVLRARETVLAAGSWSGLIPGSAITAGKVRPARGHVLLLQADVPPIERVLASSRVYLCPRDDGRVLVGSTLAFAGFDATVTAEAVRDLLTAALELVPSLGDAALVRTWASFRPHTEDERPLIGRVGPEGLLYATGHYRNGILLSAITAEIVAALALGEPPPFAWAP